MSEGGFDWLAPVLAGAAAGLAYWLVARAPRAAPSRRRSAWSPLPLLGGLALGAIVWFAFDRPLLGVAAFGAWQGGSLFLRAKERERAFREDERDAVEAIATAGRALRAGIPLSGVLEIVAHRSRGRAREAFAEIIQREQLGEELASAVRGALLASDVPALRSFGLAVVAQLQSGGNLADTTDRLSHALIERARVRRRARTIVAYSRMATQILLVLPLVAMLIMSFVLDDYVEILLDRMEGNVILGMAALMVVAGLVLVQRFGRIDLDGGGGSR